MLFISRRLSSVSVSTFKYLSTDFWPGSTLIGPTSADNPRRNSSL